MAALKQEKQEPRLIILLGGWGAIDDDRVDPAGTMDLFPFFDVV